MTCAAGLRPAMTRHAHGQGPAETPLVQCPTSTAVADSTADVLPALGAARRWRTFRTRWQDADRTRQEHA